MTDRENLTDLPPEPGEEHDLDLGIPGDAEALPDDDAGIEVPTEVNDETDEDVVLAALATGAEAEEDESDG